MESDLDSSQDDSERNEIRSELSKMSFEDLQRLKAKLGAKVLKEAMYGPKPVKQTTFKRANKNRPREVSSKIKLKTKAKVKEKPIMDPRFNRLCGEFNAKHFENTYGFLANIRKKEKVLLQKELKKEKEPERAKQIKYLIQRMENQEREETKRKEQKEKKEKEREEHIKALESGRRPHFRSKFERKIVQLVDQYSDLKKSGKVQKYIEKKQKKQKVKEKSKRNLGVQISDED